MELRAWELLNVLWGTNQYPQYLFNWNSFLDNSDPGGLWSRKFMLMG